MIKKMHDKLHQQAKIAQSLFLEFKKILKKCKELANKIGRELPNEPLYNNIERTTQMKIKVLDLAGLVSLKNNIAKITSQLFDQEREFTYLNQKKENADKDKKMKSKNEQTKEARQFSQKLQKRSQRVKTQQISLRSSQSSQIRQSRNIQIPIYKPKADTAQGTMDRISKYIASLKKNIKLNAESAGNKWKVKDYLLNQPTYLKAKTLLERYQMREEEIDNVVDNAVLAQLKAYFQSPSTCTQDDQYYYVKVQKKIPKISFSKKKTNNSNDKNMTNSSKQKNPKETSQNSKIDNDSPLQLLENSKKAREQRRYVQDLVQQDFNSMKTELVEKNQNFNGMFSKMSEIVEKGSQRLNTIRQKRRQVFEQDDDIWNQL